MNWQTNAPRYPQPAALQLASRQTLHCIIACTPPVTPEMAPRLGRLCGNDPMLWLRMQVAHDLWRARQRLADQLDRSTPHGGYANIDCHA